MTISPRDSAPAAEILILSSGADNALSGDWPDRVYEAVNRAELHLYRIANPRGQALVFAGGGYLKLMHDREGVEIALWLNAQGLDAAVLAHRLPGQSDGAGGVWPFDIALTDTMSALEILAARGLPTLLVGLSSGGHLAGVASSIAHPADPKGVLIAYAPINANHRDYKFPPGKPDFPPPEKQSFYDAWPIGIAGEDHGIPKCPIFLVYALHDPIVPAPHALNLIAVAHAKGLPLEAHFYPDAPHGFALRETDGTHAGWPKLAAAWIDHVLA
jgi:alpha-beta hydrolase superfamily lysophospholipase